MTNIKNILLFLVPFTLAYFLWSTAALFLPDKPAVFTPQNDNLDFYNINLSRIFYFNKKSSQQKIQKNIIPLQNIILKALYNDGKKAFIIIQNRNKTIFVDLNKDYEEYKLIKINNDSAIFQKNGKKYILSFNSKKEKYDLQNNYTKTPKNITIKRSLVLEYKNNLDKIWNNIGIIKTVKGYKITYVNPKSIFAKIGLKSGDIILQVNGHRLTNDAQAWQLYRNINKYNSLQIEIKRNNKLKVINYEMD